ncbi:MAG: V-type ATP synthase subunit E [Armatimonadota bacterium]
MSSELITLLEREAAAEREKLLAEAREKAEAILAQARREAEELLAAHRARLDAEAKAAVVKAQSTAQLRASSLVLQAKEEEIRRVFALAEAELMRFAGNGQRYPHILEAFIEEALRGLGAEAVVTVNPSDKDTAEAVLVMMKLGDRVGKVAVRTDPSVQGGARISSPEGRFMVTNTLGSRLERARPMLAAEVARTLWGSH